MNVHVAQEEYTKEDLLCWIRHRAGRLIELKTLYKWLPYACIKPKAFYGARDLEKLIFIANYLHHDRSLERARQRLIIELQNNPSKFPQ